MKEFLEVVGVIACFTLLALFIAPEETAQTIGHAIYTFKTALAGG